MLNGERKLIEKAKKEKIELVYDRYEKQKPLCNFGLNGSCCKNCHQGPCRTIPRKCDKGVCGINTNGVIARNLVRIAAAGASCHADHAREMLIALYKIAEKNHDHYSIKDIKKLKFLANKLGIKSGSKQIIAKKLVLEGSPLGEPAYEKFGFKRTGTIEKERIGIKYSDTHMEKKL